MVYLRELFNNNQNSNKEYVVVFGGRFQPPTPGHYKIYEWLIKNFDEDRVFIATSNKVDPVSKKNTEKKEIKSFLNFEEKKYIWKKMFNIPENKIILSKSPAFAPLEILERMPENTVYITVTSEKDRDRYMNSRYFEKYPMINNNPADFDNVKGMLKGYKEKGYYIILPELKGISATKVRNIFLSDIPREEKKNLFQKIYGKFDQEVFDLIEKKLQSMNI